jgi:hypothetical protein
LETFSKSFCVEFSGTRATLHPAPDKKQIHLGKSFYRGKNEYSLGKFGEPV